MPAAWLARALAAAKAKGVPACARRIDRSPGGGSLAPDLGEMMLDRLEPGQRPAELLALPRVTQAHGEHLLHSTPQLGGAGERHQSEPIRFRRRRVAKFRRTGQRDIVARLARQVGALDQIGRFYRPAKPAPGMTTTIAVANRAHGTR